MCEWRCAGRAERLNELVDAIHEIGGQTIVITGDASDPNTQPLLSRGAEQSLVVCIRGRARAGQRFSATSYLCLLPAPLMRGDLGMIAIRGSDICFSRPPRLASASAPPIKSAEQR